MTFLVNDRSTGGRIPAVAVTITENDDGSLSFELKVIGPYTGDLRGFFFDLADESLIGTLSVAPTSPGFTEFRQGNDSIKDLGNGASMQGLLGSDGGYDAGIEIGSAGTGKDDYQSFSFTLTSSAGSLTLEDFSNVDFGLRLTSVGFDRWGGRDGGVKLLEHTSSAIDAIDDSNAIDEDESPNDVSGNVFANDANLQPAHFVTAVDGAAWNVGHEVEGIYGTLRLNLNGSYTYTLDNTLPAVQALAEGQTVTETFSYTAKSFDEFTSFSSDSALLNITITGANDAPEISGDTSGEVFEDGSRHATGQLVGLDPDANSQLTWSVVGSGPMTPRADYRFLLDNLNIVRDGLPFFNDDFGAGGPPPAAPAFSYFTFGTFLESGGRAIMDGALGGLVTLPGAGAVTSHVATLNTDVGPDISQRLNRAQDFKVEARYDLVIPEELRSNYLVRLSDSADDIVELGVRRMEDGSVAVVLREINAPGTVPVLLETIALEPAPGDHQIVLRLQHAADANVVSASFDLLNGGLVTQTRSFTATAGVFNGEDWTRPQVLGQALATPQNGVYGTLSVEADGEWHYTLNNAAANVQALAQGELVHDVFTVTVTDEHGASDTQTVTIDVFGSNDAPVITGGTSFGFVAEDTPTQTASGQLFASDMDHGAVLRWSAGPATLIPVPGVPNAFQIFGYSSDFHFTLDQFTIEKNGATIFDDTFEDGIAPPSAPNFSTGVPASYLGTFGYTEAGGRLHLDGDISFSLRGVGNPALSAGQLPVLLTNNDPADLTRGLKSDDSFSVEGRFDLAVPGPGQAYGIALTDNAFGGVPADQLGDDTLTLIVRSDTGGGLLVQFNDLSIVADTSTTLEALAFAPEPGEDQIVLRLAHDVSSPGLVRAEFDLLDDEGVTRTLELSQTGTIFGTGTPGYTGDDENWTRAQIVAFGPDTGGATFQGTYGSLTVDQTGNWIYTLDNDSPLVQALPGPLPPQPGQPPLILPQDNISVRVVDEHGMSSFRLVSVAVAGTNDAPDITGGATTGLVYEDGARVASGQLTAADVDQGSTLTWSMPFGPAFGSVTLGAAGQWTYTLDNTRFEVQQLAQGATLNDSFLVRVSDEHGTFDAQSEQWVSVQTKGADDRPFVNSPIPFPPPAVSEDGVLAVSRQATAFDVDDGAQLTWSLSRGTAFGYRSNNHVEMDRFSIVKNGTLIFDDTFSDGIAPPSSPNPAVGYSANGLYAETNDKLVMDGAGSVGFTGVGFNGLLVGHSSLLNTNTNPADTVLGLKINHDFTIEGVFDLVVPDEPREGYGIQLTDALPGPLATNLLGDDQVSLLVRKNAVDGLLYVQLINSNTVTDTSTLVDGVPLDPDAGDQIRLRLSHDDATPGVVTASFDYLNGEAPTVLASTLIFGADTPDFAADNENWTRAGFLTLSPDQFEHTTTLPGLYGTLSIDSAGLWSYSLNNGLPAVQALAQGENVIDTFHLRVTDQFGLSNSQLLNITVTGTNDAPVAVDDVVLDPISEDLHALINVLANDFDVDNDPILVTMHNSFSVLGARITLGPAGTLDYDPTTSPTLQNLNPGQFLVDTFTYVITDTKADSLPATVTVTVFGVEDAPNTAPDITGGTTSGQVYEDGAARVARGELTATDADPGSTLNWSVPSGPAFGFAAVDDEGRWTYTLDNTRFEVQQLAQGQSVPDAFTVRVTDEHGAFDTQVVTINVTGTGDRPNFTTPPLALSVSEDGPMVSGSTSAFDVDGNPLHWSLNRGSASGYFSDYEFRADSFSIEKNGAPLIHDDFDAGGPPPSAPNFANDTMASYTTTGQFAEIDGKLVMRGDNALAFRGTGNDALVVGNEAILATNVDPANTVNGLKKNHQFVIDGVFDLVTPQLARQAYGLTLTDAVNRVADDLLSLVVARDPVDGQVYVRFNNSSSVLDTLTLVDRDLLVAGEADQIRLVLSHAADSGDVAASYELLEDGAVIGSGDLGQAGIFGSDTPGFAGDDENWIRAGLFSNGLDAGEFTQTLSGAYGTLTVDNSEVNSIGQLIYTPGAAAQALTQGEVVVDSFFVRVIDPQGMSNSQRVDITVTGFNDPPEADADSNSVVEDVVTRAVGNVVTNDFDPDQGSILTIVNPGQFFGTYGTLTLNLDGSYVYQLDHAKADSLAEGQVERDSFEGVYGITDGVLSNFATLLEIEITGTGEAPVPLAGEVFEDGSRSASGQLAPEGTWSIDNPGTLTSPAYRFLIDNFRVVRNNTELFNDDFGGGGPPPSAPNFANGTPASYQLNGSFIEAGGRVILDGSRSVPVDGTGTPQPRFATSARLSTDTSTDLTRGLKIDDSFTVEGRFDLVLDLDPGDNYGVRLTDSGGGVTGSDIVQAVVRRDAAGNLEVALVELDGPSDSSITRQTIALEPLAGENQIVLKLAHDPLDPGAVEASFDLLGGPVPRSFTFSEVGHIFGTGTPGDPSDDEVWTRAEFRAAADGVMQNGVYGTLSIDADGGWDYLLNNAATDVQALAQDEHVSDMFLVRNGAGDTQVLRIDAVGSDDAPVGVNIGFASFFQGGAGSFNGTYVIEDSAQQVTRGHAFATDVDHDALVSWSVNRNPYTANYHFTLDQFTVKRGTDTIFDDAFDDGNAPPLAPNFANGAPATYGVQGGYTESLGRVNLDGALAGGIRGIGNDNLLAGHLAVLLTNVDPADLTRGLKSDDDFSIEARFDLAVPGAGQAFGIGLTDNVGGGLPPDQLGDDNLTLLVRLDPNGNLFVQFNDLDIVADTSTEIERLLFKPTPGENQIVLRLIHDEATPGLVHAEFDLLGGAGGPRTLELTQPGHIFGTGTPLYPGDDENWTRPQFVAFGEDTGGTTVQGTYGSVSIDPNGDFTYTLDNGTANVQALAQGQVAIDSFNVRATDQYGVSNRFVLNVNVIGTGEATPPEPAPDVVGDLQNNVLIGSALGERLYGDLGADLLIGLDGSDVFDYNALSEGGDTIADFTPGAGGDILDLRDLLPPGTPNPADFVQLQQFQTANGPSTTVLFDHVPLATLQGVGGLSFEDFSAHNLLL